MPGSRDGKGTAMRTNDNLRAEYLLLQGQYEAYDQRALSLKALVAPLLGAGIAIGLKEHSLSILSATAVLAASLWYLEAVWKSFQYCFTDRIKLLESWFRGEGGDELHPFQIFTSFGEVYHHHYRHPLNLMPILGLPFVLLPYAPIVVLGLAGTSLSWLVGWPTSCGSQLSGLGAHREAVGRPARAWTARLRRQGRRCCLGTVLPPIEADGAYAPAGQRYPFSFRW